MNKSTIISASLGLVAGLLIGGAVIQVRIMSRVLDAHTARISTLESTLGQVVNFLNGQNQGAMPTPTAQPDAE